MDIETLKAELDEAKAAIESLTTKNREILAEKKKLQAKTQEIDFEAYSKAIEENESLKAANAKLEKQHKQDVEKLSGELGQKDSYLQKLLIEDGLTKGLIESGIDKQFLKAALAMLKPEAKVNQSENGYDAVIGDKPIAEYLKTWVESDGAIFVPKQNDSGAGARGGAGEPQKQEVDISKMSSTELMKNGRK